MRWSGILLGLVLHGALACAAEPPTHEEARQVMGTVATVQVWTTDVTLAETAVDQAFAVFTEVDSLMSTWNGNSALSRLNRAAAGTWLEVGEPLGTVISTACRASRLTGGAFDPTVLPLVRAWGFRDGRPAVPDSAALYHSLDLVDVTAVEVEGTRARLLKPGQALDLGGIAKGYALDQAALVLRESGVRGGVLDLGGNLLIFGQGPAAEVGIVDPGSQGVERGATQPLIVPVGAGAVATSGQYERFVSVGGHRYGHILDSRTGWPAAAGVSATVITSEAIWADALATAVVVLGATEGLALLERLDGVEGVVITADQVQATSGLQSALADQGTRY